MKKLVYSFVVVFCLAIPTASAKQLSDGLYRCQISGMHLGDISIEGSTFRGPAFDNNFEGTFNFTETADGVILWDGPLGGISAAGTVVSTVLRNAGENKLGFDVTIKNDSGNFQTVSCYPNF